VCGCRHYSLAEAMSNIGGNGNPLPTPPSPGPISAGPPPVSVGGNDGGPPHQPGDGNGHPPADGTPHDPHDGSNHPIPISALTSDDLSALADYTGSG
jgi:hypothetical protein